jgi:hypothetical protein
MVARRIPTLSLLVAGASAAALIAAAACSDSSNMVTGPTGTGTADVNVTGTWNGTFHSEAAGCSSVPVTATLTQHGTAVTGSVITSHCGLSSGYMKATISGRQLTGTIGMMGCTGGTVSGTVTADAKQIAFTMEDLKKPLVTGDQIVAPGGDVSLSK